MTYPSSLQIRFILKFVFMILEQIIAHVTIRRRFLCWTQPTSGLCVRGKKCSNVLLQYCSMAAAKWCEECVLCNPQFLAEGSRGLKMAPRLPVGELKQFHAVWFISWCGYTKYNKTGFFQMHWFWCARKIRWMKFLTEILTLCPNFRDMEYWSNQFSIP